VSRSILRGPGPRRRALPVLALAALAGGVLVPVLVDGGAAGAAPSSSAKALPKAAKPPKGTTVDKNSVRVLNEKKKAGEVDASTSVPKSGPATFLLELDTEATGATFKANKSRGVPAAKAAARGQLARVKSLQSRVRAALPAAAPRSKVVYSTSAVLAGVAVKTDAKNFESLKRISGVKAVYPVSQKVRSNAGAIPLQGGPAAWQATGATGEGVRVGIIDTGIDYTHADFGGPGTVAAYEAAHAKADGPNASFAGTDKVVGGYDFAGDDYDGSLPATDPNSQPVPDPDPLDCNGHGSHVAGSAAGFGVKADGSTFTGPYNASTNFGALKIGPGMAPDALLYALRVFGCEGSTNVVTAALDWAADPNGDQDFSDHLDVVNMSLGSDFGDPQDGDSIASNRLATLVGTSVVASIGNGADVYDVGGSPGNATQVLAVAASDDGYSVVDGLKVTAPASIADTYPGSLSVLFDYSGAAANVTGTMSAVLDDRDACVPLSAADAAKVNGKIATVYADLFSACGSIGKANNVAAAGAIGMVIISDDDTLESGINGNADIPAILITKSAGDAIVPQLGAGVTVTFGAATHNAVKRNITSAQDTLASFSSRGIRKAGNVKPDVTAVGSAVFSAGVGTGNDGATIGGTSMASPMVAGLSALVRERHPDWSPAEVKANIMNTATADIYTGPNRTGEKYAPGRVGSGRIVANDAVANTVLAYVKDDPGAVSVSFGPVAVTSKITASKQVRVANKGSRAVTVNLSYAAATTVPGVTYTVSDASVSIAPKAFKDVTVTMTADPALMTKTIDPTVEAPSDDNPRQFVAEASGRLIVATADGLKRRVPVYAAPRPASTMTAPAELRLPKSGPNDFVTGALPLSGKALAQGDGATRIDSLVSGLELQATSPQLKACAAGQVANCILVPDEAGGDFKYVGAVSDSPGIRADGGNPFTDGLAYFGVSNWGAWRTPTGATDFRVVIDTNRDGKADAYLETARATDTDILLTALYTPDGVPISTTGQPIADDDTTSVQEIELINGAPGNVDTAIFDSDSLVLPVAIDALPGVDAVHPRINWAIQSGSQYGDNLVDTAGFSGGKPALTIDVNRPALSLTGPGTAGPTYYEEVGTYPVLKDVRAAQFDKPLGLLLIHHHNVNGKRGQAVLVRQPSTPRLEIVGPTTGGVGMRFSFKGDVPGIYGINATGNVVLTRTGVGATWRGTLVGGRASGKTGAFGKGTWKLRLDYAGDSQYAPAFSNVVTVVVK
jgi:subtilisin family serine protease